MHPPRSADWSAHGFASCSQGPTKWLWPTAYEHPRSYVPGGDILLEFGSVVHQHGGKGTGIVIGNPASYSSVEPGSFPSPSASDGYPSP